jgi:hypothetical protein
VPCALESVTVTVTVTGNLLNTKVLTLVSRQLSQPVQSPSDMRYLSLSIAGHPATSGILVQEYRMSCARLENSDGLCTQSRRHGHEKLHRLTGFTKSLNTQSHDCCYYNQLSNNSTVVLPVAKHSSVCHTLNTRPHWVDIQAAT